MLRILVTTLLACLQAFAQPQLFLGAGPGLAILSGEARAQAGPPPATSQYSARNSALLHAHMGLHLHDYFSIQGAYVRTKNDAELTNANFGPPPSFVQQKGALGQHQSGLDLLVYFRDRKSWVRPFLSTGLAVSVFDLDTGAASSSSSTRAGLRIATGVDIVLKNGWGFRYSFLETITGNPLGERLLPAGRARLMTFQNLFGAVKYF
jgi:hypothetical protein